MESKQTRKKAWPKNCPWQEPGTYEYYAQRLSASMSAIASMSQTPRPAEPDPARLVANALGYEFLNHDLLRQAFTRRAFALEYGLGGCGEELEFLGDAVLNQMVSKELICQLTMLDRTKTDAPFCLEAGVTEGVLSKLRSECVCKERLSSCLRDLGLDGLILYGTGETPSDSTREDALEALIGAIAIDSDWHWKVLEGVVSRILPARKELLLHPAEPGEYDRFNAWHKRRFGVLPEYEISERAHGFFCGLQYYIPENDRQLRVSQYVCAEGASRSAAREWAAHKAREFVVSNGLWAAVDSAAAAPRQEDAINRLQELYQKKALPQPPSYSFQQLSPEEWQCVCFCGDMVTMSFDAGKKMAKKEAACDMLNRVLGWPGIPVDPETGFPDQERRERERARARNIERLYKLSTYERNWDGEGAPPFSLKLIRDVCCAIRRLEEQPVIEPSDLCCIRLIFGRENSGNYLEIELYERGLVGVSEYQDGKQDYHGCELVEIPAIAAKWRKKQEARRNHPNAKP